MTMTSFRAPRRGLASHVLVMVKAPLPGLVKTRMCPPLSHRQAAEVAAAAVADTLDAVGRCGADRQIVALAGPAGDWLPPGFEVVPQVQGSLDRRLAAAWAAAGGPGLQIGMDTPQVTADLLDSCLHRTFTRGVTASLGRALDGGWWAIGLGRHWDIDVFTGVPMSTAATGRAQLERLVSCGHRVAALPARRDVDRMSDAVDVAARHPDTRFAAAVRAVAPLIEERAS
jgi:glycosyltransferase A (GT-A) superfamily protein (DUF2064 family)